MCKNDACAEPLQFSQLHSLYLRVDQAGWWVASDNRAHALCSMSIPQKLSVLIALELRAAELARHRFFNLREACIVDELKAEYERDYHNPLPWIRGTKLYKEVLRQVKKGIGTEHIRYVEPTIPTLVGE